MKLTLTQLRLLHYMHTHDLLLGVSSGLHGGYHWKASKPKGWCPKEKDAMKIHSSSISGDLFRSPYLDTVDKTKGDLKWAWWEHAYRLTDQGHALFDDPKVMEKINKAKQKEEEERKSVERLIILPASQRSWNSVRFEKGDFHQSRSLPPRAYGILCKVIRETPKKLYVEIVKQHNDAHFWEIIHGNENRSGLYVDRTLVTVDNTDEETFDRLVAVEDEKHEGLRARWTAMWEEMAPIWQRYQDRDIQADAMHEDEIAGILRGPNDA